MSKKPAPLLNRTNPAIQPRTQRFIEGRFAELEIPVLATRLYDREAFRAMFSFGGTVAGLGDKVSNLAAAQANAGEFTAEVVERLRGKTARAA